MTKLCLFEIYFYRHPIEIFSLINLLTNYNIINLCKTYNFSRKSCKLKFHTFQYFIERTNKFYDKQVRYIKL